MFHHSFPCGKDLTILKPLNHPALSQAAFRTGTDLSSRKPTPNPPTLSEGKQSGCHHHVHHAAPCLTHPSLSTHAFIYIIFVTHEILKRLKVILPCLMCFSPLRPLLDSLIHPLLSVVGAVNTSRPLGNIIIITKRSPSCPPGFYRKLTPPDIN